MGNEEKRVITDLTELAAEEARTLDHEKKLRLFEEWCTEAMRTKLVPPDRMEDLFLHWLSPRDPRFPQRGSLRDICPTVVELAEDHDGIPAMARRARDLMFNLLRQGIDLDVYQVAAVMEELAAKLRYREGQLTVNRDFTGKESWRR